MTRLPCLALFVLLAPVACHQAQPAPQPTAGRHADRILCAHGGAALTNSCEVELAPGGLVTVRDAEGGFHRLRIAAGGRGVVSADGAAPVRVTPVDQSAIEVAIGGDRFRLPATVKAR